MSKFTRNQKIEIYKKRKEGKSIAFLSSEYSIRKDNIIYLVNLIDKHGEGILRKDKNNYYSPILKEEIINKVILNNQSVNSTAIEYGLSSNGILFNWIKSYKENGYAIVGKTRGRQSTMKTNQSEKEYKEMTIDEKMNIMKNAFSILKQRMNT